MKSNMHKLITKLGLTALLVGGFAGGLKLIPALNHPVNAAQVYDISQWQGWLSNAKVRQLKREVPFVILRAQDGGLYQDSQFRHNAYLMRKYHIPYGVYSYDLAKTPTQARGEAYALVKRAPKAKFYVNDVESTNGNANIAGSARAWAKEVRRMTHRPTVLYSYSAFMNSNLRPAINAYSTIWLAQYSDYEPSESYHYDLWQFTDSHFSRALGQRLDDSTFPDNARPISFWIGGHNGKMHAIRAPKDAYRNLNYGHKHRRRHHVNKHHHTRRNLKRNHKSRRRIKRTKKHYHRRSGNHSVESSYDSTNLNPYINSNYYSDPNANRFKVIAPRGIELYSSTTGRKIHHLKNGATITRGSYQLFYRNHSGLVTKGIGVWHGHEVAYTMNRSQVRAY